MTVPGGRAPWAVRVFGRLAGFLLPREIGGRYGEDLRETFEDLWHAAGGARARTLLFIRELWWLVRTSVRERGSRRKTGQEKPGSRGTLGAEAVLVIRSLRRTPGWSLTMVSILALGMSSVALVFTILNGTLLRRLPFPESERLVMIWMLP